MNLLFDNIIFSIQQAGGISVYWYELLRRLKSDPDIEATYFEYSNQNIFRKHLEIPQQKVDFPKQYLPITFNRYINPTTNKDQGIFHSSYYRTISNKNIRNITTVHDFTYEYYRKGLPKKIHSWQKSNAIKKSDHIICVSNNTKIDLLSFYSSIPQDRISVIYNGVDEEYKPLASKRNAELEKYIKFSSMEYLLYIGDRRSKYKNFITALNACKLSHSPLVIVGGGRLDKNEMSLLQNTLGVNNFEQLTGINNKTLNILYNNALGLLYPSIYEGFGIPIIEAQKAGCPVICSDRSSIPEVAGKGAFIINDINANKIADILLMNKSRSHFTDNIIKEGFLNANRFSWDKCYEQTKQVYLDLCTE